MSAMRMRLLLAAASLAFTACSRPETPRTRSDPPTESQQQVSEAVEPTVVESSQVAPVVPFWKADVYPNSVNVPVPAYPESARAAGIEGVTIVEVLIDTNGSVADARISKSSGDASLDQAAVDAALGSSWTPASRGGKHVRVWVIQPYRFPPRRN
jgi:protein TonB